MVNWLTNLQLKYKYKSEKSTFVFTHMHQLQSISDWFTNRQVLVTNVNIYLDWSTNTIMYYIGSPIPFIMLILVHQHHHVLYWFTNPIHNDDIGRPIVPSWSTNCVSESNEHQSLNWSTNYLPIVHQYDDWWTKPGKLVIP